MASEAILKFLGEQNRPFSTNDVIQNLGKDHPKSAVQKTLEKLAASGKLMEKIYGKQKIYCVVQPDDTPGDTGEELQKLNREINEVSASLKDVEEKLRQDEGELKSLQGQISVAQARAETAALKEEIGDLKVRLNQFKEDLAPVPEEEKRKIMLEHERYAKEYRKRKRISMDIINTILESYPKTKKHLLEDIGIETDEDVGYTFV